jgi:hypothetical protein
MLWLIDAFYVGPPSLALTHFEKHYDVDGVLMPQKSIASPDNRCIIYH